MIFTVTLYKQTWLSGYNVLMSRAATTHPWEKNSPVFENTAYLDMLYEDKYKSYIKAASINSRVSIFNNYVQCLLLTEILKWSVID